MISFKLVTPQLFGTFIGDPKCPCFVQGFGSYDGRRDNVEVKVTALQLVKNNARAH